MSTAARALRRARASAWAPIGAAPDERHRVRVRVRSTLVTIIVVALLLGLAEAGLAWWLGRAGRALWLLAAVTVGFAAALLPADRRAARGDLSGAVTWTCVAVVAIQASYLLLYPRAYPAICIASFVVVALALSFVSTRSLLRITWASWAVAAAAVFVGTLGRPLLPVPAEADVPIVLGSALAAVTVGMVLLYQFAHHMLHALEESRRLERARTEFINTAAHELNTPLTPVLIQLDLLRSGRLSGPAHDRSLDVVGRNVARMGSLVREMLDVARMQAGRLALRREEVALGDLVREAVGDYAAPAEAKGIRLTVQAAPLRVSGDPQRIAQVVSNLLSNALRVTPAGGAVTVAASAAGDGGGDPVAVVRVRDTGLGLSPEQIGRLFQPFTRIHEEAAGTSGLGLYICHGLMQEMGGRLWAASDGPGRGATFSFSLPVLPAADAPPSPPAPAAAPA